MDPYALELGDFATRLRRDFYLSSAIRSPLAQAKITGVTGDGDPLPVAWRLWTRQMLGVQEGERDSGRRWVRL